MERDWNETKLSIPGIPSRGRTPWRCRWMRFLFRWLLSAGISRVDFGSSSGYLSADVGLLFIGRAALTKSFTFKTTLKRTHTHTHTRAVDRRTLTVDGRCRHFFSRWSTAPRGTRWFFVVFFCSERQCSPCRPRPLSRRRRRAVCRPASASQRRGK